MRYRIETSVLYPLAYRVIDTQRATTDPQRIVADNVTRVRALALVQEEGVSMCPCPACGSKTMTVGHHVTIWQTIQLELTDDQGHWKELNNELHDQVDAEPFEQAECDECGFLFNPEEK